MIPEFVSISDGKQSELIAGRGFDFPKGSIIAFDKGYVDYGWYKSLTDKGVFFVTRLRPNSIYKVLERREFIKGQGVTSDQVIQLNSAHALKRGAPRLRRVGFRCPVTGRHYVFLTNNFKNEDIKKLEGKLVNGSWRGRRLHILQSLARRRIVIISTEHN